MERLVVALPGQRRQVLTAMTRAEREPWNLATRCKNIGEISLWGGMGRSWVGWAYLSWVLTDV